MRFKDKIRKNYDLSSETFPTTVDQLYHILNKIENWKICTGGPLVSMSPNVGDAKFRKLIKVDDRWTHADCQVIIENGSICKKCVGVQVMLQNFIDRLNKKAQKRFPNALECVNLRQKIKRMENSERLDINATPRSKGKLLQLRKKLHARSLRLKRKEKKVFFLEGKIREIANKDFTSINDFLKANDVPEAQVRFFPEIWHNFDK